MHHSSTTLTHVPYQQRHYLKGMLPILPAQGALLIESELTGWTEDPEPFEIGGEIGMHEYSTTLKYIPYHQ
jgi:hypothetical protein